MEQWMNKLMQEHHDKHHDKGLPLFHHIYTHFVALCFGAKGLFPPTTTGPPGPPGLWTGEPRLKQGLLQMSSHLWRGRRLEEPVRWSVM